MLVWLENAPTYDPDYPESKREVCDFIDEFVTCSSKDLSPELLSLQKHKHSHTCYKKLGQNHCRFNIPYFPMDKTTILEPLSRKYSTKKIAKLKRIHKTIQKAKEKEESLKMTFKQFLMSMNMSYKTYILAIRSSIRKPQVFLKRDPCDMFISPFSKKMIKLMRSNQNLQFVLDAYGAACYVIDYINKSDRGMSNLMRDVLNELRKGNTSLQTSLRKISNTFHNNSELSVQEACYNILQLQMSRSSEECIFIPTFPPSQRVRMVKSNERLADLPECSTDIFETGLLDHYSKRPKNMNMLTLAEFAADYTFTSKSGKNTIKLLNNAGYIRKRLRPRTIRFRNYHFELDPDNYIREHLMLYHPWRNETRDLINSNNALIFKIHQRSIKQIKKKFNAFSDKTIDTALSEASERSEDYPITLDKDEPTFDFDDYQLDDPFVQTDIQLEFEDTFKDSDLKFTSPRKLPESEYQALFEKLNQDQRDFVMHIGHHFKTKDKQKLYFLTGGAGVGKSLVIQTLYQTLFRIFNSDKDSDPDIPKVLLCAPTGKAAFNIKGQTLHSAFRLPLNQKTLSHLSASMSNTLATKLAHLKVLIIDEISMVGQHTLKMVDQRLQHIFGNNRPFGGVSVIAVGDFCQLRPVFATPLFFPPSSNPYEEIFEKPLWSKFKVFQLKQIMRQNELHFQTALNNLAKGKLKSEDIDIFKSRTFQTLPKKKDIEGAVHLFAKNTDVDTFNERALSRLKGKMYKSKASDVFRGSGTQLARRQLLHSLEHSKTQDTMGIPSEILLKVKGRYVMTYNVDVDDGLCNGATGTLRKIDFGKNPQGKRKPLRLWIEFDDITVGANLRKKYSSTMKNLNIPKNWTPVTPIALTVKTKKNSHLKVNRKQFPLTLAHAMTIHKSQGMSLKKVVVHIKNRMTRELLYVACSRATSLNGLFIIGNFFEPKRIEKNSHLAKEMKRWKKSKLVPKFNFLQAPTKQLKVMYHNVQSLKKHVNLVRNDKNFTSADVLIFGETWTKFDESIKIKSFRLIQQTSLQSTRKPGDVSIYVKKYLQKQILNSASYILKDNAGQIDVAWIELKHTFIIGTYAKPQTSILLWNKFFKSLPHYIGHKTVIIMGDVNVDSCKKSTYSLFVPILKKFNLKHINKNMPTTYKNTALDWVLSNKNISSGRYCSFFSYHDPIWACKNSDHSCHQYTKNAIN